MSVLPFEQRKRAAELILKCLKDSGEIVLRETAISLGMIRNVLSDSDEEV